MDSVLAGTTSEEGVIFVYSVFSKPVSAVESTVYLTAIFKQHALRILHKYLPLYREADHRGMLAQVGPRRTFLCCYHSYILDMWPTFNGTFCSEAKGLLNVCFMN